MKIKKKEDQNLPWEWTELDVEQASSDTAANNRGYTSS
jgi:hypothetical protein